MLFNFFIPTICETSHSNNLSFKCEYISHGIHPLKRKPFLINEYPMIALSAQSWLFDPLNHCYQHALVFCIVVLSTVQRSQARFLTLHAWTHPLGRLSIQWILMSTNLPPPSYWCELVTKSNLALKPIVVHTRGINTEKIYNNGPCLEHTTYVNLTPHFNPKP